MGKAPALSQRKLRGQEAWLRKSWNESMEPKTENKEIYTLDTGLALPQGSG